jgi:hypothetical protein
MMEVCTNGRERIVLGLSEFTDADIQAIENTTAPSESSAFDQEFSLLLEEDT